MVKSSCQEEIMSKKIIFIGLSCAMAIFLFSSAHAQVIFQDSFDSSANWTVTQPTGSSQSCYSGSCGVPGGWTGYYNGANLCTGVSGAPGNNLLYINQYAGYPSETNTCRSGKCLTIGQESCVSYYDNSDGMLMKDLGQEYEDLYIRIYIRFKSGWQRTADNMMFKLFHVYHWIPGTSPYQYHGGTGTGNQPLAAGGIAQYGTQLFLYGDGICQVNLSCHGDILWSLGTITAAYQSGGIFDGNWHAIEWRFKRNSAIGAADGLIEAWFDGAKKSYVSGYPGNNIAYNDAGSSELRGFRVFNIGGNAFNQWNTSCSNMSNCEQWYAIDDVVVSTQYIGLSDAGAGAPPDPLSPPPNFRKLN
jgi:hypothetical protein